LALQKSHLRRKEIVTRHPPQSPLKHPTTNKAPKVMIPSRDQLEARLRRRVQDLYVRGISPRGGLVGTEGCFEVFKKANVNRGVD